MAQFVCVSLTHARAQYFFCFKRLLSCQYLEQCARTVDFSNSVQTFVDLFFS
jgi:hypothetical protein